MSLSPAEFEAQIETNILKFWEESKDKFPEDYLRFLSSRQNSTEEAKPQEEGEEYPDVPFTDLPIQLQLDLKIVRRALEDNRALKRHWQNQTLHRAVTLLDSDRRTMAIATSIQSFSLTELR